ncbi:hypothetical protein BV22DRAFT_1023013 [Leucogyrophana mollusca]|uniref:Uncharacterized protein n=1 Tax=Leucogyrophana mollusca TaxID=85980 RepID=A0ACB8B1J6_9AGAM|nr:hypothetical protein BV22DRAFT_1023013 [Leucogyrophana mollusca]
MPTLSIPGIMLEMGQTCGDPWGWPTWQGITGTNAAPWVFQAIDTFTNWTQATFEAVSQFRESYLAIPTDSKRRAFLSPKLTDRIETGRNAYLAFITDNWNSNWDINRKVDELLLEQALGPFDCMRRHGTKELLTLNEVGIQAVHKPLARLLFGNEALTYDRGRAFMRPHVVKAAADIRRYVKLTQEYTETLVKYSNQASLEQLRTLDTEFAAMMAAIGVDKTGKGATGESIPKNLANALKLLADRGQVASLQAEIEAVLKTLNVEYDPQDVPQVNFDEVPLIEWKEGVEHFNHLSLEELWVALGLPDYAMPFFQKRTDPTASVDPWMPEGEAWLKSSPLAQELAPCWHQLVGILFMVDKMLKSDPVLLMDEVGVGKTMQAIGLIAIRSHFYDHYHTHNRFPGIFVLIGGEPDTGNLADVPSVIVCPPTLLDQFTAEIHRYLEVRQFNVLPYTSSYGTRTSWWTTVWPRAGQPKCRCIVLTTHTALMSDAVIAFEMEKYGPSPAHAKNFEAKKKSTIYGLTWGVCILDEAHCARKYNSSYNATRGLRETSLMTVALTATPILTKPADDAANKTLHNMMHGQLRPESPPAAEYREIILKWMGVMRDKFTGYVVRHTIKSKDNTGKPISGLEDYTEHNIVLRLYTWEKANLDREASELADDHGSAVLYGAGKVSSGTTTAKLDALVRILQYHLEADGRQPLKVHINGRNVTPDPDHPPQAVPAIPADPEQQPDNAPAPPDKIVVYSVFPSSNKIICDIFKLFGIQYLELNGQTPMAKRQDVINQFRDADRDGPRVLILSGIGSVWSAQEDAQLKGRVWRQPQKKKVRVYRLIADKTPDVFLNNISFDKGAMLAAFVGSSVEMRA